VIVSLSLSAALPLKHSRHTLHTGARQDFHAASARRTLRLRCTPLVQSAPARFSSAFRYNTLQGLSLSRRSTIHTDIHLYIGSHVCLSKT
jgi:hypothetical protein